MENQENMKLLEYKKMQELLPDYVFGRISDDDRTMFESSLNEYPDLIEEINQVKSVFKRVDLMDLDSKFAYRSRNVSVKVVDRLRNENRGFSLNRFAFRYLAPTLAVLVIGLAVVFNTGSFRNIFNTPSNDGLTKGNFITFTDKELNTIIDSNASKNEIIETVIEIQDKSFLTKEKKVTIKEDIAIDDFMKSFIFKDIIKNNIKISNISSLKAVTYFDMLDDVNNLNDKELLQLLKELENADFSS